MLLRLMIQYRLENWFEDRQCGQCACKRASSTFKTHENVQNRKASGDVTGSITKAAIMCLKELEKYYRKMCFFYNNHSNSLLLMKLDLKKKKKFKSQGAFFRRRMCESLRLQKVNWAFCLRIRGQKVTHCFLAYPSESPCVFNTFPAHTKLHCSKP